MDVYVEIISNIKVILDNEVRYWLMAVVVAFACVLSPTPTSFFARM